MAGKRRQYREIKQALKDGDYASSLITAPITAVAWQLSSRFSKISDIKQSVKDYVEILNKQDLDDGFSIPIPHNRPR
ncbi:MAG: hypothetical protein ACLRTQ_01715 [Candidatus Borkfalkia sp.]